MKTLCVVLAMMISMITFAQKPSEGALVNQDQTIKEMTDYSGKAGRLTKRYLERKEISANGTKGQGLSPDHLKTLHERVKSTLEANNCPQKKIDELMKKLSGYSLKSNRQRLQDLVARPGKKILG